MEFVIAACVLGLITGAVAKRKGRPFLGWFAAGAMFAIVFLPWAIFMKTTDEELVRRVRARGIQVDDPENTQSLSDSRFQLQHAKERKRGRPFSFSKIFATGIVAVFVVACCSYILQNAVPAHDAMNGTVGAATAATPPAVTLPPQQFSADVLKAMYKGNNLRTENALKGKWADISGTFGNVKSQFGEIQAVLIKDYEWNEVFIGALAEDQRVNAENLSSGDVVTLRCLITETVIDIPRGNSCIVLH